MIKNIIFDIGNVLVDFRWKDFMLDKGVTPEMAERIANASVHSKIWNELDRGVWSYEQVIKGFMDNDTEIAQEIKRVYADTKDIVSLRDYAIPFIKELKEKGLKIYYLSNWSQKLFQDCQNALSFLPLTDGGVFSWQENVIKPDFEIYRILLSRYGLEPKECVFIDDSLPNVTSANELGITGIHFQDYEQVRNELLKLSLID